MKIQEEFIKKFMDLLGSINNYFTLDLDMIELTLLNTGFQSPGETAAVIAIPERNYNENDLIVPVVCITNAPHSLSQTEPVLEFGLLNKVSLNETVRLRVCLSMFANGQQVLRAYGLTLNTNGKGEYETFTMAVDPIELKPWSGLIELLRNLILNFPITTDHQKKLVTESIADLNSAFSIKAV